MKTVAIIPARGGSKGIPRKNIKLLAGEPLIGYTIKHALNSKLVDRVFVSTDDEEIKEISLKYGAEIIDRPAELATDTALSEPVILHAIDYLKKENYIPEIIVFLQCTCPFRRKDDIDNAIKLLKQGYDSVLSVYESKYFVWRKQNNEGITVNFDYKKRLRRQDREKEYTESGSIFVFKREGFEKYKNRLFGKIGLYTMPKEYSFEIDTKFDFQLAELAAKYMFRGE